jgi:hypothetical protein
LACVLNRRRTGDGSFRFAWAADTARVLQRTSAAFNWDRLLAESRELKTLYPLRESLAYLRRSCELNPPEEFLNAAFAVRLSDADCDPFRAYVGEIPRSLWSRSAKTLARPYRDYCIAETTANRAPTLRGMLHYWSWRLQCEVSRNRKAA